MFIAIVIMYLPSGEKSRQATPTVCLIKKRNIIKIHNSTIKKNGKKNIKKNESSVSKRTFFHTTFLYINISIFQQFLYNQQFYKTTIIYDLPFPIGNCNGSHISGAYLGY